MERADPELPAPSAASEMVLANFPFKFKQEELKASTYYHSNVNYGNTFNNVADALQKYIISLVIVIFAMQCFLGVVLSSEAIVYVSTIYCGKSHNHGQSVPK